MINRYDAWGGLALVLEILKFILFCIQHIQYISENHYNGEKQSQKLSFEITWSVDKCHDTNWNLSFDKFLTQSFIRKYIHDDTRDQ